MSVPIRTPLTKHQQQTAERMKQVWLRKKAELELTQVAAAERLGITQGSFTQYLNQHIAVNTDFVLKFCTLMQIDPAEIDPKLANVLLSDANRVHVEYEWGGKKLPTGGAVSNVLVEHEPDLFGVRVPADKSQFRRRSIAIVTRSTGARKRAIAFILAKGKDWEFVDECTGGDCWSVLAFVREK